MLPPRDPENEADIGLITMPHLNNLRIEDKGHICIDLWALLDTPSTAKITIFSHETSDDVPSMQSILPPLIRCSHKYLNDHAFSDLSLRFDTLYTGRATLILAPPQPAAQQTATSASDFPNPATSTSLNIEVAGLHPGAFFRSLTTAIPMKLVKTVVLVSSFQAAQPLNDADIRSALGNADSVSALELHGNVATAGLRALLSTASHDQFLPNLKRLHLHIADLELPWLNGDASAIDILNRALDARHHHHGLFLDSLSFKECNISESSVAHLREEGRWGGQTRVEVD
ncbi:hypothetical protein PENSPDRAFT_376970 [Peniophora sp. CONT]|nr:hypothetical protein PENSPDRAFT_376970 [Peniophora sp. CONT]